MRILIVLSFAVVQLCALPAEKVHPPILPKRAISLADFMLHNPIPNVFDPDRKREVNKRLISGVFSHMAEDYLKSHPNATFNSFVGKKRIMSGLVRPMPWELQTSPVTKSVLDMVEKRFITGAIRPWPWELQPIPATKSTLDLVNKRFISGVFSHIAADYLKTHPNETFNSFLGKKRLISGLFHDLGQTCGKKRLISGLFHDLGQTCAKGRAIINSILDLTDKRYVIPPLTPELQQLLETHPGFLNMIGKKSTPPLTPIQEFLQNNPDFFKLTGKRATSDKRYSGPIGEYLHDHPGAVLTLPHILRSAKSSSDKRNYLGPVGQYIHDHPGAVFTLPQIVRSAESSSDKRVFTLTPEMIQYLNSLMPVTGRSVADNLSEKKDITLSPDWMSHVILPGGMSLELYNHLINFGK